MVELPEDQFMVSGIQPDAAVSDRHRTQRVIDTAEFVLRQLGRKSTAESRKLQQALTDFRLLISGLKLSDA